MAISTLLVGGVVDTSRIHGQAVSAQTVCSRAVAFEHRNVHRGLRQTLPKAQPANSPADDHHAEVG